MSTAEQRKEWRELAERALPTTFQSHYGRAIKELLADVDRLTAELAQVRAERDDWKAAAKRERERREYDSVDAYNARINEAVRHLREQEERGIR